MTTSSLTIMAKWRLYCNCFFVLLWPVSVCGLKFTSPYNDNKVTGVLGSSVNFTWAFNGALKSIQWGTKKDDVLNIEKLLVTIQKDTSTILTTEPPYSGHVSGVWNGSSPGQATFTLNSIQKTDERTYICRLAPASLSGSSAYDLVQLLVVEPPQISILSVPASYNEGSLVNISCMASGTPDPDVQWIRNKTVKSSGKKTAVLTFSSINRADDGQYTCKANNSAGNDEKNAALVVHYKPEGITLNTSAADNTVTQGGSVTFTCHVTAAKPKVSQYRFYLTDASEVDSSDNHYTIFNVQRSQHYGKYKCVPSNDVGDGPEAAVILNVNVPVQLTAFPQNTTVIETNPFFVSCNASGFPEPSFTWTKDGQVFSQSKELTIQRSHRSDTGMYVCTASNGVGQDKTANISVTVQYPPTLKAATTSTNKSWINQTVTLKCVSDGVPTPTLTWYKPDGSQINRITVTQVTVNVKMTVDQDFGNYTCIADNGVTPADSKIVKIEQIEAPGSPTILPLDIQATSLTVKWTAPADDGGSPITAYRVVILKDRAEVKNENITDPGTTSLSVGGLMRSTNYTVQVFARNAVFEGPAVEMAVKTKYEGVPAAATIDDTLPNEVTDDTVTLKWSEPQNNGKEITRYTLYQRVVTDGKQGEWIKFKTITNASVREFTVDLAKGKVYEFVVTATNDFGESLKEPEKFVRVMASGVPAAVELNDIPSEVTDNTIMLQWSVPENYGRKIEQYTVYKRIVVDGKPGEWMKLKTITDVSVRELTVELERGKEYEFVVTATNIHGESKREEGNIKRVIAKGEAGGDDDSQQSDEGNRMGAALYAGAAAAGVLLIIGIIVIIVLWRRRKSSIDEDTSRDELGSANPYESEDGYHSASREAAQSLQASVPAAEPDYALVDQSRKKKKRMPANDEYAQVDKSKKTKKKKKPGELDYADLEDLRADIQLGPVPSGGAAGAAPIVRPPTYEGTEYADISQFGVPHPDPTYANVPKQEVVYSNVESM